jgi:hypothetical protein
VGRVFRYGARVASKLLAAPYHAPVNPKKTCPLDDPAPNTSSAPNSEGMLVVANVWKDAIALEAVVISILSQPYWNTVAEAGAGKVCTSTEVTMPKEGGAPRIAWST